MTRLLLSSWKRPRAGLLVLCLSLTLTLTLTLAACGASTGGSDQTGGAPTATSGSSGAAPTATTSTGGGAPTATPAGSGTPDAVAPPFFFTVRATASNSAGDYTVIDNVVTNGDPGLLLFVTANYNPNGASSGVYDNHPLGVFYIAGSTNKWAIYHDDKTPYTLNASYNVWARETSQPGTFIWRATASSSAGDYTVIDNPATNGKPNAVMLVTHNWNPGGVAGVYENHRLGVFYIGGSTNKWAIYHQDQTAYTPNANYNVYATTADGATRFVQRACTSPCSYDYTTVNSSASNAKPSAIVFVTANWNPGGSGGVYDNHNLGVFYASNYLRWAVYHQDQAAYIANSSFNVVIPQSGE